jgi:hypothetical protein
LSGGGRQMAMKLPHNCDDCSKLSALQMYLEQASTLVDRLVYEFNGEHLNDLERSIVEGVSEGKKHGKIAEEIGQTTRHVTDAGAKLWEALSKALGEKVSKH